MKEKVKLRIYLNRPNVNNAVRIKTNIKDSNISKSNLMNKKEDNIRNYIIIPNVIDQNIQPYRKVYNNANLGFNSINKNDSEKTDEELNLEVDRRIYEMNRLEEDGIEFNSPEFKKWLQKNKENLVIPVDAPAKVRKEVMDMFDSIPDSDVGSKFSIAIQINNIFGRNSIRESQDIIDRCKDIISENSDYINVLKMCNSNSMEDLDAIDSSNKVIDFFKRLEDYIKLNYIQAGEEYEKRSN